MTPAKPYYRAPGRPSATFRHPWRLATVIAASWCILYGAGFLVWLVVR